MEVSDTHLRSYTLNTKIFLICTYIDNASNKNNIN